MKTLTLSALILFIVCVSTTHSQTSSFTYQGKLADAGVAANGTYDITFKLYDMLANGTQIGVDVARDNVVVSDGIFSVDLDFGAAAFASGAPRFLQIEVRPGASVGTFTTLAPRQPITSAPYGVKTINASVADSLSPACVSCVTDTNINTVSATKVTGVLNQANGGTGLNAPGTAGNFLRSNGTSWTSSPIQASDIPALNNSFIQNIPGIGQQSASFNIDGGGSANIFNATTQYNIGGNRLLSIAGPVGSNNLFVGLGTGQSNTGTENTFVGRDAGLSNNNSQANSFFGAGAGQNHIDGNLNSFFGVVAGSANRGFENSFFGSNAGVLNGTGGSNSFFGARSGETNTFGDNNTFVGYRANPLSNNLTNATAIGSRAVVSQNNSLVLGSIANVNGAISDTSVGIGTTAPAFRLDVVGRSRFKQNAGDSGGTNTAGFWLFQNTPNADRSFIGMETDNSVGFFGNNGGGWGLVMNTQTGTTSIRTLATVGSTSLCRNGQNEVSFCSSSLKYKTNISAFNAGLSFVNKLRPISFDWKDGGTRDVGFGAEDIAKIDPRFVTYNDKGEVEGVKYDRLSVAFVNAFKEQQAEISGQKSVIDDLNSKIKLQQTQIDALTKLVCSQNPAAELCQSTAEVKP